MDEDNDVSTAPAEIFNENEKTPKPSTKKSPRTYSKRKRPGPMNMAHLLNSSPAQEQAGSKKRPRADGEDSTALLSGKENREPGTAGSYWSREEQGAHEPRSSPPPMMKKQRLQPATQHQQQSVFPVNPKTKAKKKEAQHTLELRLGMPAQTFRPGHMSDKNEKKTGWFSPEEIKALENYKEEFCRENAIHGDTFDECIQAPGKDRVELFKRNLSHMGIKEFWNGIYLRVPGRDRRSTARFMRRHFQPGQKKRYQWTEEDDDELERLHKLHGPKWTMICAELDRGHDDVVQRWKNKVEHRSTMRGGIWSREEFEKLIEVIEKTRNYLAEDATKNLDLGNDIYEMDDKNISWGAVSDYLGNTRSRQQAADKWRKIRAKVDDARQNGKENATYLDVYDFKDESNPMPLRRYKSQSVSRSSSSTRKKTPAKSQDFVFSDDDSDAASDDDNLSTRGQLQPPQSLAEGSSSSNNEDQQEPDSDNDSVMKSPASSSAEPDDDDDDDDNNSTIPNPFSLKNILTDKTSNSSSSAEPDNNNNNDDDDDDDENIKTNNTSSPNTSPYNPLSINNILADETPTPTPSQPNNKKHKRSKAEKAEAKAARKAERKAQRKAARKAARKEARRAQKRAMRDSTASSSGGGSESVSVKRESTQESNQV